MTAICALAGAAAAQDMPASVLVPVDPPAALTAPAQPGTQTADAQPATPPPDASQPATPPVPGPATPAVNPLNKGQLEQLVAPIALYPDPLLSQVLMASTYPIEIVEADRWLRDPAHASLKGQALTDALKQENWDPSVMALAPFPKLLGLMADRLQWTEQLGNAFLAQQADVMSAVQALRHDAMAAGNLKATPQCHCVIQTSGATISILPSDTNVVCVPVYNPRVAYGAWPVPEYPPYFFPVPADFYFEPGFAVGFWPVIEVADYGPLWGWWSLDWGHDDITINRGGYAALDPHPSFAGNTWVHDPAHRGGVAYSDPAVTSRFGAARVAAVTAASRATVGRGSAAGLSTRAGAAIATTSFAGRAAGGRFGAAAADTAAHGGAAAAATSAGRFGGRAAIAAGRAGAVAHVGHASFSAGRSAGGGAAHFGGPAHGGGAAHAGGAAHFGGAAHGGGGPHFSGGGGHAVSHASFAPAHMGGAPHFGGGGGHGGGAGGGGHGGGHGGGGHGGGGGGHGGGGGGGHGGGGHH